MTRTELARTIEHTLLKAEATTAQIDRLCDDAREYGFVAVCVNPVHVQRAALRLVGSSVRVASVVGFPLGAGCSAIKAAEARRALDDGAVEIDMVAQLGALLEDDRRFVADDIRQVAAAVHAAGGERLLKVILETAALPREQIILGCRCAAEGEADFVKTSTGFHPAGGATVEAVRLLHQHAAPIKVKASGGIRDWSTARALLAAGATRLGTSAGVAILKECP
ncbi:MAG TPA: deoxyribose-phosphate aldolase [Phycisphaerae bacterium]